ncbi:hypothetical protein RMATCC62417_10615 [Rhizopus microsporus]|nr:hypothetical protein RMATCC62417_10615 [Rhizopus microsporus]
MESEIIARLFYSVFIAVHVGAGNLSKTKEPAYRALCAKACKAGMEILKSKNGSAIDAVAMAIKILEDDPITNAGYGSNLTIKGTVECDASIMEGARGTFGAVGAVSGIKNPIMTAKQLVFEGKDGLLPLGRMPPMLLVGQGAREWAKARNNIIVEDEELIEQSSLATFAEHMSRLIEYQEQTKQPDLGHDTVGAVCIDQNGNTAAGVSSGGISLKFPGRVGEAAMYGCGCWAQNERNGVSGVACSTTGTGEQIMRTMLTYKCASRLQTEDDIQKAMTDCLKNDFLDSPFLDIYDTKSVGIIMLRVQTLENDKRLEFWYGHTTEDMGVGYMSSTYSKPKTFISRKTSPKERLVSSGWLIK